MPSLRVGAVGRRPQRWSTFLVALPTVECCLSLRFTFDRVSCLRILILPPRDRRWSGQALYSWVSRAEHTKLLHTVWRPDFLLHLLSLPDVALVIGEYKPEWKIAGKQKGSVGTGGAEETKGGEESTSSGTGATSEDGRGGRGAATGGDVGSHATQLHDRFVTGPLAAVCARR